MAHDSGLSDETMAGGTPDDECRHEWVEEYYGYRCKVCDRFYAYGCEPWYDPADYEQHDKLGDTTTGN